MLKSPLQSTLYHFLKSNTFLAGSNARLTLILPCTNITKYIYMYTSGPYTKKLCFYQLKHNACYIYKESPHLLNIVLSRHCMLILMCSKHPVTCGGEHGISRLNYYSFIYNKVYVVVCWCTNQMCVRFWQSFWVVHSFFGLLLFINQGWSYNVQNVFNLARWPNHKIINLVSQSGYTSFEHKLLSW